MTKPSLTSGEADVADAAAGVAAASLASRPLSSGSDRPRTRHDRTRSRTWHSHTGGREARQAATSSSRGQQNEGPCDAATRPHTRPRVEHDCAQIAAIWYGIWLRRYPSGLYDASIYKLYTLIQAVYMTGLRPPVTYPGDIPAVYMTGL